MSGTADRIVDLAERFVMERGYHAWSYQHVAAELGVKPAAIHYHYRTRPELVAAMLDRYRKRFVRWARSVAEDPPAVQLRSYVALSRGLLAEGRIDPYGTMAAEFATLPPEVQGRMQELQREIFGWFATLLAAGREAGTFRYDGPPSAKAAELACALLGAQQLGRVSGAAAFEEVAEQISRSLGL